MAAGHAALRRARAFGPFLAAGLTLAPVFAALEPFGEVLDHLAGALPAYLCEFEEELDMLQRHRADDVLEFAGVAVGDVFG